MQNLLRAHQGFILASVRREFHARHRSAVLGTAWAVLQPLAQVAVYTTVFSTVLQARLPGAASPWAYSIYLCAGILTWGLWVEVIQRSTGMFLEHAGLIKKLRFHWLSLPVIVGANAVAAFGIGFGLFLAFLGLVGQLPPGWTGLWLVPVLALQLVLAMGLGLVAGVLNVFFRDVAQLVAIGLPLWFWCTPIVYPASILPVSFQALLPLNPMAGVMQAYQTVLVTGQAPLWTGLWPAAALAVLAWVAGVWLMRQHASDLVDEL